MTRRSDETVFGKRPQVLLIEDEPLIAEMIGKELEQQRYEVSIVETFDEGRREALLDHFEIVILDRMLRGVDALPIVEMMRQKEISTPVFILSGLTSVDDRIRGLRAGGDDYLVKPFAMGEFIARVDVLVRRGANLRTTRLRAGPVELDLIEHSTRRNGRPINLLPREFKILEYFMRRPDQLITRDALLKDIWRLDTWRHTNVVDVHLSNLRRKLDAVGQTPLIVNVRGTGFMFHADEEATASSRRRAASSGQR